MPCPAVPRTATCHLPPATVVALQVLILKDFKDFPAEEITVEFWMMSTGGLGGGLGGRPALPSPFSL